jgi:hypothetical protein
MPVFSKLFLALVCSDFLTLAFFSTGHSRTPLQNIDVQSMREKRNSVNSLSVLTTFRTHRLWEWIAPEWRKIETESRSTGIHEGGKNGICPARNPQPPVIHPRSSARNNSEERRPSISHSKKSRPWGG